MGDAERKIFRVLLVEDSPIDVALTLRGLKRTHLPISLTLASDGAKYLSKFRYEIPNLVIIGLNLPNLSGKSVIRHFRSRRDFDNVPILVFSASTNPVEVEDCRLKGANAFVQKPLESKVYVVHIQTMVIRWLHSTVKSPLSDMPFTVWPQSLEDATRTNQARMADAS